MAKQATRLSDFQIPRADGHASDSKMLGEPSARPEAALPVEPLTPSKPPQALAFEQVPESEVSPIRITPRPPAEPRQALTVRLPVSMHERIRTLMFTSRRSQQDIVEEALTALLKANGT